MLLCPVDESRDILPVMSSSDRLTGPEAAARLVQYRLSLLRESGGKNRETDGVREVFYEAEKKNRAPQRSERVSLRKIMFWGS